MGLRFYSHIVTKQVKRDLSKIQRTNERPRFVIYEEASIIIKCWLFFRALF
ncbi:hypothetical protein Dtox_3369 [Desulfofarcimen acetoxidans DSM 771]|uniref:Uncharacterized protein n=1 Tax=Desulfofarcimen acetoxidans (strain ATCC 49208 / DSM 771 / KCTC 5769 / VKM B-1644 / 5575) TaxID=485916 RepID=C8W5U9_DESAS|nr:hypothetical protein Dtox_3369 [Desulfofarcimen acetoxidans DSM 771]